MKRIGLALLLIILLFSLLLPKASAEQHIGSTPVQMIPVDSYEKEAEWGTTTVFLFGLFNGGADSYLVEANVSSDRNEFAVAVYPASLTLENESFVRISVNVTALGGTGRVRTVVSLRISVSGAVSGEQTFTATLDAVPKATLLDVATSFIAIGFIILIGFSATLVFERTGVPDILLLIVLGLLLGPIASQYLGVVIVSPRVLSIVMPYVVALALVMILFDGGLNLNLETVLRKLGIASLHTVITFVLSAAVVLIVTHFVFGYPLLVGLLLGVMLGGICGTIVTTLVRKMHLHEDSRTILVLESVITDVLSVILALAIVELMSAGPNAPLTSILPSLLAGFSIAIVIAFVFGVIWLRLLTSLSGRPFAYMITFAALLVLYAGVEIVGGSGAAAALVFGLVLGNHDEIARMFKIGSGFALDDRIKHFQTELAFVVKTFFFVFLGLVFSLSIGGSWAVSTILPLLSSFNGTFTLLLTGVVLMFLGFVAVRFLATGLTCRIHSQSAGDKQAIKMMMARGLAAAVLTSVPFTVSAFTNPGDPSYLHYRGLMSPYQAQFMNIVFMIILLTVVTTAIGVAAHERRRKAWPLPSPSELEGRKGRKAVEDWKKKEAEKYREKVRNKKAGRRPHR